MASAAHGSGFTVELEEIFSHDGSEAIPLGYLFSDLAKQPAKQLPESAAMVAALRELGETMRVSDSDAGSEIPAGYTYFGQFVAHDIIFFDMASRAKDASASCDFAAITHPMGPTSLEDLRNKRSSQLELDSVYSGAPRIDAAHLQVGSVTVTNVPHDDPIRTNDEFHDVPRITDPSSSKAFEPLIGDPRNDNNVIVSQLHVAFLRAHNALVDQLRGPDPANAEHFEAARKLLRQLYHQVLIHDYLKTIADPDIVDDVLHRKDPICDPDSPDFCLPLEFTVAAFRFGHSMIRKTYYYNDRLPLVSFNALIPRVLMRHGDPPAATLPASRVIQWKRFIADRNGTIKTDNPNFARPIGTTLVTPLFKLLDEKGQSLKCEVNLAVMDLLRGYMLHLPTGQAVADELIKRGRNIRKLTSQEVVNAAGSNNEQEAILRDPAFGFSENTPLWFYILAEANQLGGGNRLGPVGSTIVAEVLIALVRRSSNSILPKAGSDIETENKQFKLADLLRLGGVFPEPPEPNDN